MQYIIGAIVGIGVAFVLYKIAVNSFSERYGIFISGCYLAALWPVIIFIILAYFFPILIGNEDWLYFIIYVPFFSLFYLPFTIFPVIVAHVSCKIKYRGCKKSTERVEKLWWATIVIYFIIHSISIFILPVSILLGMFLIVMVSVLRIIRVIIRKKYS